MPKKLAITKEQAKAIAFLADGMSKKSVAMSIGKTEKTISRWCQSEPFASELQAELDRRREKTQEKFRQVADEQIESAAESFKAEMEKFHKAVVDVQMQRLSMGRDLIDKAYGLLTAADAKLSPSDAIKILDSADRMFDKGLTDWGNAIAIEDVLKRLSDGG